MRSNSIRIGLAVTILILTASFVRAGTAEQAFAKGRQLLGKGDFRGAMDAYAEAVQANRENQEYLQQYALVRRIVQMREQFDQEQDPTRWEYLGQALHTFYVGQRLYAQTAELDRKIHSRLNTAASAVTLAETLLAMDENAEAAQVLAAIAPDKATPASRALLGIALAREGKLDQAKALAGNLALPSDATPGVVYTVARLQAVTGDRPAALLNLTRCLESLAPSRQESFQSHARVCPDFAGLTTSPEFAQALAAPSKVAESKCSGGKSCAGCPMRGKCPSSQGQ